MQKNITIVGSTGSIGIQALDVVRRFPNRFKVVGLSARSDWKTLAAQVREFKPCAAAIADESSFAHLRENLADFPIELLPGEEGNKRIASIKEADMTLISVVGMAGLLPTLAALEAGMTIALATKEVLVVGGDIVMKRAREKNLSVIPVDSEHSAIFQCLCSADSSSVSRILLTSSGGPFRGYSKEDLGRVTLEAALAHPTWNMGRKITIDSATLMNKGFEVLEAYHLFEMPLGKIEVLIHPQSIIHSLVEFCDGSTLAQLSQPDMRLPIQYALGYPERLPHKWQSLNLEKIGKLTFDKPDPGVFRCLDLAYEAGRAGFTMPCVLNAANEVAVERFLKKSIAFPDISEIIEKTMEAHKSIPEPSLSDILEVDRWARNFSHNLAERIKSY